MLRLSNWSVSRRLFALSGVGIVSLAVVSLLALVRFQSSQRDFEGVIRGSHVLKNQVMADMLHDGIRGDVLSILVAATPEERTECLAGMNEHTQGLRDLVQENAELLEAAGEGMRLELGPKLGDIRAALEGYVEAAVHIGEEGARDPAAARILLPDFERSFTDLEGPMEAFSDEILALNTRGEREAGEAMASSKVVLSFVGILSTALLLGCAIAIRTSLAGPLSDILAVMRAVSKLDFTKKANLRSSDEIGEIARATNTAIDAIQEAMTSIERTSSELSSASLALHSITETVCEESKLNTRAAATATSDSHEFSENVHSAASGVQELDTTTQSISESMSMSAQVARNAVEAATSATEAVRKLGQSSHEIGGILRLINSVAEQTNLLALNATIEAASAGEAGRGFAVVANEVKALAQQTARATEDIARRVQAIQADSQGAFQAIDSIARIIEEMRGLTEGVSSALMSQSSTVSELASRVSNAAQGSAQLVDGFRGVAERAESSLGRMEGVAHAADQLNGLASSLGQLVRRYNFQRVA